MRTRTRCLYVFVTPEEYTRVLAIASSEHVSIANLLRRCINDRFVEDDAADVVLTEATTGRPCRS